MQREDPFGAIAAAVGGRLNELADGVVECERQLLDTLAQRVPGDEAVLAGDHRLRVVQRERAACTSEIRGVRECRKNTKPLKRSGVVRVGGVQKILGLPFQLIETGPLG